MEYCKIQFLSGVNFKFMVGWVGGWFGWCTINIEENKGKSHQINKYDNSFFSAAT